MTSLHRLIRDGLLCLGLFVLSISLGLAVNLARNEPLPWVYRAPASGFQRMEDGRTWSPGIAVVDVAVAKKLVEGRGALVLDARPDLFYEFGHLPGAENLSRKNFEADFERLRPNLGEAEAVGVPLLIYCAHQHCEDASKVAEEIKGKGYPVILIYEGGYDEWERLGLEIEKGR